MTDKELNSHDLAREIEIVKLQEENEILKDNAENNGKVVDKVNWENMLLKKENKQSKDKLSKIETLIINHNCDTGDIYYKYNSRFLKSELKQRILEIVYEEGSDNKMNDKIYPSMVIRSQAEAIELLEKENQELKKKNKEYKRLGFKYLNDKCNILENQQKQFIKYLEDKIKKIENNHEHLAVDMFGSYDLNELDLNILKEILQKYK